MVGQGMGWGISESCRLEALWEMLLCLQHSIVLSFILGRLGQVKKGESQEHLAVGMLWLFPAW